MVERICLPIERQLELLKILVSDAFGINTKLDFSKWKLESDKIVINDIDWTEDLLSVLDRLREHFYVSLETTTEEIEVEGQKTITANLNLELMCR